jgi:RNA polymerase sigma factor (sigma-70 family)
MTTNDSSARLIDTNNDYAFEEQEVDLYTKAHTLLPVESTRALIARVQAGGKAYSRETDENGNPVEIRIGRALTARAGGGENAVIFEFTEDAQEALEELIQANMGLVRKWAHRLRRRGFDDTGDLEIQFDDLVQEGIIGLITSVMRFDLNAGTQFSTAALPWVRHRIVRFTQMNRHIVRWPVHLEVTRAKIIRRLRSTALADDTPANAFSLALQMGVPVKRIRQISARPKALSLDTPIGEIENATLGEIIADPIANVENEYEQKERLAAGKRGMAWLRKTMPVHSLVVSLYYGGDMKLAQIARHIGISPWDARKLLNEGLAEIRRYLGVNKSPLDNNE